MGGLGEKVIKLRNQVHFILRSMGIHTSQLKEVACQYHAVLANTELKYAMIDNEV